MSKLPSAKRRKSYDFSIAAVRHRWEDKASRYALSSLVPRGLPETLSEAGISTTQLALVAAWRRRVKALAKGGWIRANDPDKCKYLLGCPPVGVLTRPGHLHCCRRAAICPFCWCRWDVSEAYRKLKRHVNGRDIGKRVPRKTGSEPTARSRVGVPGGPARQESPTLADGVSTASCPPATPRQRLADGHRQYQA